VAWQSRPNSRHLWIFMFSLHPQLDADTFHVGELPLSKLLLMNQSDVPWAILVPRRNDILEWHHLNVEDQQQLHAESMALSAILMNLFKGDKLNTGALGNLVPQLHLHHIVRFKHDEAWPRPIWGNITANSYSKLHKKEVVANLASALADTAIDFSLC